MLHKDFFRLIIKLFGLYSLIVVLFTLLPEAIPQLFMFEASYGIFFVIPMIAIPVIIYLFLLFKTDLILKWLRLTDGFEEEKIILGDMSTVNLLKLASIIMGGLLIINNLPFFFIQSFFLFKDSLHNQTNDNSRQFQLSISAGKILIGYLMLRKFVWIGKLLRVKEE